jgi:Flp pilus assembly pilin Flp
MREFFKSLWSDESGQGLAEYAVLITLIAIVLFSAIILFRNAIINVFSRITSILNSGT